MQHLFFCLRVVIQLAKMFDNSTKLYYNLIQIKNGEGKSPKERIDYMSLTRKLLKGMSLTEEQMDTIITEHTETVNSIKEELDAMAEENETLKANIGKEEKKSAKAQKELDELKASMEQDGVNPWEQKYNDLKAEHDKYVADVEKAKEQEKVESAYKKLLKDAGISEKRVESVLKLAKVDGKLDGIEFDEKGEVKGADKLKESIKADYSEYVQTEQVRGAETATPPTGDGKGEPVSRAQQLAQQYHDNLYGVTKKE